MNRYQHPTGHVFYRKMAHARPMISHGDGIYLYDTRGKQYIDGSGGPFVVNVGHGRREIVAAMEAQASRAAYTHAIMFTSEAVERVSDEYAKIVPIDNPRFFYLSSGSEVVEAANKLARQIQLARGELSRRLIISRSQSYHGMTLGALASSGRIGLRRPFLGMLQDMPRIKPPYVYRYPATGAELADRLERRVLEVGPENVAAFLAEPISGASLGAAQPPDDYWPRIRAICDKYGLLLIADEVLVGMGRTGRWWAIDHWGIKPDIMTAAKGTAGGYMPHGFLAARQDDIERMRQQHGDFNHGGTYSHHAVAGAAALATLGILQREQLVERSAEMGALLGRRLRERLSDHPHVGDIRGRGLFWGIELVADRATKAPFAADRHLAWHVFEAAFDRGLIVYYSQGCVDGQKGDLIMVGPPFIVTPAQIDDLVERLHEAIVAAVGPT